VIVNLQEEANYLSINSVRNLASFLICERFSASTHRKLYMVGNVRKRAVLWYAPNLNSGGLDKTKVQSPTNAMVWSCKLMLQIRK